MNQMTSRERFLACMARKSLDRLPIKHHAVKEIDDMLEKYYGVDSKEELLNAVNDDFRDITASYVGPDFGDISCEHGVISGRVWREGLCQGKNLSSYPLSYIEEPSEIDSLPKAEADWFDYSNIEAQCDANSDYARIFGYCEMDFMNNISILRGEEQALIDLGTKDPVYFKLIEHKYEFVYEHIKRGLEAGKGKIEIVHFGEDLGSQRDTFISPETYDQIFRPFYKEIYALVHKYGAKTAMHCCGSARRLIPALIEAGLDILDVVQTKAAGMEIKSLHDDFGSEMTFMGSMCVQDLLPFGTPEDVRREVDLRKELFRNGGLIIGPSHLIQRDGKLENIVAMYEEASKPF
jgi:uroporphyrinogen decarboxylase